MKKRHDIVEIGSLVTGQRWPDTFSFIRELYFFFTLITYILVRFFKKLKMKPKRSEMKLRVYIRLEIQ